MIVRHSKVGLKSFKIHRKSSLAILRQCFMVSHESRCADWVWVSADSGRRRRGPEGSSWVEFNGPSWLRIQQCIIVTHTQTNTQWACKLGNLMQYFNTWFYHHKSQFHGGKKNKWISQKWNSFSSLSKWKRATTTHLHKNLFVHVYTQ